MITVPVALVRWRTGISGDAGRTWLDGLPGRVAALCAAWDLVPDDTPPLAGALALVVLVRRGPERLALRVCWPEHDLSALLLPSLRSGADRARTRRHRRRSTRKERLVSLLLCPAARDLVRSEGGRAQHCGLLAKLAVPAPAGLPTPPPPPLASWPGHPGGVRRSAVRSRVGR